MSKTAVLVLGASGMLGAMVTGVLSSNDALGVTATVRENSAKPKARNVKSVKLDAESASIENLTKLISDIPWVINCIGIIKPYIHDDNSEETIRALKVNSLFPHNLAKAAEITGSKVIQIATDCAYSGAKGSYVESDVHDALDVYGKTKSLGEVYNPKVSHLRCSIIGPEPKAHVSLLDWFLSQPKDAAVNGFTNHRWNGVTTFHFARLCQGIIHKDVELGHLQHIVPEGTITKADMLKAFAKNFNREDIKITLVEAEKIIDRTLQTENQDKNEQIWAAAGYKKMPTVEKMIEELAGFKTLV